MAAVEGEYIFQCPYCLGEMSIAVDYTAGRSQDFTQDCEVCCQPIAIRFTTAGGEVTGFSAEKES